MRFEWNFILMFNPHKLKIISQILYWCSSHTSQKSEILYWYNKTKVCFQVYTDIQSMQLTYLSQQFYII